MFKTVMNCATGEVTQVALTQAEIDAITPSLAERKESLCDQVDALRDAKIAGGFTHTVRGTEYGFQSRASDRENVLGLAIAAKSALDDGAQADQFDWLTSGTPFAWITADNTLAPMDAYDMLGLYQRGVAFKSGLTFFARGLKDAILAAADATALDAIDIEAGWPD